MNSPLSIIIGREYFSRVKRKSFIISTILMPLFMIAMMVVPVAVAMLSTPDSMNIAVVDQSGVVAPALRNEGEMSFVNNPQLTIAEAKADETYDGVLVIGNDIVQNPAAVTLYTRGASSMLSESVITSQLNKIIQDIRLEAYNIPELPKIMQDVQVDVSMTTFRLDDDQETETSSVTSYAIGMIMSLMLYMFIMLYGQMVMTSIIEEKNNRVLEIVVSSVKPSALMMGKICGIGLVALTQILIWAGLLIAASAWIIPGIAAGSMSADAEVAGLVAQLGNTAYVASIFAYIVAFLVGGYLFYSAIYAAIGSAVDNVQDASQLQTIAIVPIILAMVLSMSVISDPNSQMAFWASIIPFTSPVVMMARIPFGIPGWEIALSLVLLYASFFGMIWFSAKVYRVGIFMYGKKPTLGELVRWARYK
ncbi:MAG: ABC transporter permease [Muribaculaceae bacterium]